jgi:hypothetical protein
MVMPRGGNALTGRFPAVASAEHAVKGSVADKG